MTKTARNRIGLIIGVAILMLGLGVYLTRHDQSLPEFKSKDMESFRQELRDLVANGSITTEEAHVYLAIAQGDGRFKSKKSQVPNAIGEELKKAVDRGEMTAKEAKTRYYELIQGKSDKIEDQKNDGGAKE